MRGMEDCSLASSLPCRTFHKGEATTSINRVVWQRSGAGFGTATTGNVEGACICVRRYWATLPEPRNELRGSGEILARFAPGPQSPQLSLKQSTTHPSFTSPSASETPLDIFQKCEPLPPGAGRERAGFCSNRSIRANPGQTVCRRRADSFPVRRCLHPRSERSRESGLRL